VNNCLLTRAQAAEELGCSLSTLKRRIAAGDIPVFLDGRLVRIREADLRRYVLERVGRRVAGGSTRPAGVVLPAGARLSDA
jgi:excisionase family DNA binding protein